MRVAVLVVVCLVLGLPQLLLAEYIEITLPVDWECYRPCAPGEVRWESDIDPGEGAVIEVLWNTWQPPWNSLGLSSNDGVQTWPDPPCWGEHSVIPIRHEVKVVYTTDPSVYDVVTFWTHIWVVEGPYTVFIDFTGDETNYEGQQSRIDPVQYTGFWTYVGVHVMDNPQGPSGFTEMSFALDVGPHHVLLPMSFENLLPGDLATGSWDEGTTIHATECVGSYGQVTYVARLEVFYLGGSGDIVVVDHPDYPKRMLDCAEPGDSHQYVLGSHGGVGKDPVSTPVERTSWGAIKALYRN